MRKRISIIFLSNVILPRKFGTVCGGKGEFMINNHNPL